LGPVLKKIPQGEFVSVQNHFFSPTEAHRSYYFWWLSFNILFIKWVSIAELCSALPLPHCWLWPFLIVKAQQTAAKTEVLNKTLLPSLLLTAAVAP